MFKPTYRISPYLIGRLEKIAIHAAAIQGARLKFSLKAAVERDVFSRSVHSSTWIEGNRLSLAQVQALAADQVVDAEVRQKQEVTNCINAMRWVLAHKFGALTEAKLLKVHALMTKGLLPQERCGKYRKVQNYIVNARNAVIFTPPPPSKVGERMRRLLAWLQKARQEHPVVRSAVFHHQFVAIHPFVDGNGRVARAVAQWLLFQKDYEPLYTLALDEFFAQDRAKYYDMIQQTHELDGDHTYWIEYVADGLLETIKKVDGRIKGQVLLTPKQEELMALLQHGPQGSAEICKRMKINRARVNQLVSPLVQAGIVIREGKTRGARYMLR